VRTRVDRIEKALQELRAAREARDGHGVATAGPPLLPGAPVVETEAEAQQRVAGRGRPVDDMVEELVRQRVERLRRMELMLARQPREEPWAMQTEAALTAQLHAMNRRGQSVRCGATLCRIEEAGDSDELYADPGGTGGAPLFHRAHPDARLGTETRVFHTPDRRTLTFVARDGFELPDDRGRVRRILRGEGGAGAAAPVLRGGAGGVGGVGGMDASR
jgi:hypothetical protein